jgi:WD40 repeat protein
MFNRCLRLLPLALVITGLAWSQQPDAKPTAKVVTFKDHVAPILRTHCLNCHNPDKSRADLNVATYQALMAGGSSGEAIAPGSPDKSRLYRLVAHLEEPHMPPKQPRIPDADLAVLRKWIEDGAPETAVSAAKTTARKLEIDPVAVSTGKPEGPPPMPAKLAAVSLPQTARAHPVTAMAASPWAPLLAIAGHERVLLYNTETLKQIGVLPFPERIPYVLRFSRNGKWLLAAGGRGAHSGRVVLWDVTTGQRLTEIGDETDIVLAADVSPNHKLVALSGPSKIIKVYDTATGELRQRIKRHTDWVTALEFSPDGTLLASGDRNGGVYVWEAETGGIVFTLGDHRDAITALSWRADSQMLATASEDGRVILWFAEDGFPTRSINAHADGASTRTVTPLRTRLPGVLWASYARNGHLVTCGRDNTARVWRPDGNLLFRLEGFTDLPSRVVFSHDGDRVFAGDFTGKVRVWSVKDKQPLGELTTNPE